MSINKLTTLLILLSMSFSAIAKLDYELVLNEPGLLDGSTKTIEVKFQELLKQAVPGSEVLMNIYGLKMSHISKAILEAQARGVKIGIILRPFSKEKISYDAVEYLLNGDENVAGMKGVKCSFGYYLKICGMGCSAPAFNHNKFFLFSELSDGSKNISIHTSNNFWPSERNNFNDFLIIKNDLNLYSSLRKYWLTLQRGKRNPRLPLKVSENMNLHTFPKPLFAKLKRGEKRKLARPVKNLFNSVKCLPGSRVHIAHSRFTNARASIADILVKLKKQGCDVKLFIKNDVSNDKIGPIKIIADSPGTKVISKLGDILYFFPYEEGVNGRPYQTGDLIRNALHSKIILIDAIIGDNPMPRKLVVVGTHNFDMPSLKLNNEIMLEIFDDNLFDEYEDAFQRLHDAFLRLPEAQERTL